MHAHARTPRQFSISGPMATQSLRKMFAEAAPKAHATRNPKFAHFPADLSTQQGRRCKGGKRAPPSVLRRLLFRLRLLRHALAQFRFANCILQASGRAAGGQVTVFWSVGETVRLLATSSSSSSSPLRPTRCLCCSWINRD